MNKDDIKQFIKAFADFSKHAEVELMHHNAKQAYLEYEKRSQRIIQNQIERKAAKLNVSPEYYVQEFM